MFSVGLSQLETIGLILIGVLRVFMRDGSLQKLCMRSLLILIGLALSLFGGRGVQLGHPVCKGII